MPAEVPTRWFLSHRQTGVQGGRVFFPPGSSFCPACSCSLPGPGPVTSHQPPGSREMKSFVFVPCRARFATVRARCILFCFVSERFPPPPRQASLPFPVCHGLHSAVCTGFRSELFPSPRSRSASRAINKLFPTGSFTYSRRPHNAMEGLRERER